MMDDFTLEKCVEVSELLKSLSHPHRLMTLCLLSQGEKTVLEMSKLLDLPQPTVSRHLNRLKREAILSSRRDGQFIYYKIGNSQIEELMQSLHGVFCPLLGTEGESKK